jgi:hypothetical protein
MLYGKCQALGGATGDQDAILRRSGELIDEGIDVVGMHVRMLAAGVAVPHHSRTWSRRLDGKGRQHGKSGQMAGATRTPH